MESSNPCIRKSTLPKLITSTPAPKPDEENRSDGKTVEINLNDAYSNLINALVKESETIAEDDLKLSDDDDDDQKVTVNKEENDSKKKIFKSKEYLTSSSSSSSSSSESDSEGEVITKKRKIDEASEELKSNKINKTCEKIIAAHQAEKEKWKPVKIDLPPLKASNDHKQCRYIFVKAPNKGNRCTKLSRNDYCGLHNQRNPENKKNLLAEVAELRRENMKLKRDMKDLKEKIETTQTPKFNIDEIESKYKQLVKMVENVKNEIKSTNLTMKGFEERFHKLETHHITNVERANVNKTIDNRKLQKLATHHKYKLLQYIDSKRALFGFLNQKVRVTLPTEMEKKCPEEGWFLIFNADSKLFEWVSQENVGLHSK